MNKKGISKKHEVEAFYRRVQRGKRYFYEPTGVDWSYISMPAGSHLLTITPTPNGTLQSYSYNVNPDRIEVLAAIKEFEGALVDILRERFRKTADTSRMTKKQRAAWKRFEDETGICAVMLTGPDAWAAAKAAAAFLEENA